MRPGPCPTGHKGPPCTATDRSLRRAERTLRAEQMGKEKSDAGKKVMILSQPKFTKPLRLPRRPFI